MNSETAVNELELISKEFRCHNMDKEVMKVIVEKPLRVLQCTIAIINKSLILKTHFLYCN